METRQSLKEENITMNKYKVGIIGCGAILPRHLEAIHHNSEFELVAVCDIQSILVNNISKRLGIKAYTDYKEMIKSGAVNFITIATPNFLHLEQALYALNNDCDVLIEKPVAFNVKDVDKIIDIADKKNKNAYCVLQVRLNPTVQLLKQILSSNILGNIRGVNLFQQLNRWIKPI